MKPRFNSCREQSEKIALLAAGALPQAEQVLVRSHLAHCAPCRHYYEEMAELSLAFQQWTRTQPAREPSVVFRSRWMRSVETAGSPRRTSLAALLSRFGERLWPSPAAWGALAAIWVFLLLLQWATPAERATGHEVARSPSSRTVVTFAQRQRELSSLLETLAPPPLPSAPERPRPRSQRRTTEDVSEPMAQLRSSGMSGNAHARDSVGERLEYS